MCKAEVLISPATPSAPFGFDLSKTWAQEKKEVSILTSWTRNYWQSTSQWLHSFSTRTTLEYAWWFPYCSLEFTNSPPQFFLKYNTLLVSPNYVTKRQSIKLLGEILLDRANYNIMLAYVDSPDHLKLTMNLLRDKSKNIQYEAFHVFKVFILSRLLSFLSLRYSWWLNRFSLRTLKSQSPCRIFY